MPTLRYQLLDVFTNQRFGGNQLAVFLDARDIPADLMQTLARELNLAETVYVLPPDDHANHFRLRIFTPATEMMMAGHPTVGAVYALAKAGMIPVEGTQTALRLEEKVGLIPVTVEFQDSVPTFIEMQQPLPTFGEVFPDRALAAELLSLEPDDLVEGLPVQAVSCGVPFLFFPVATLDAMRRIRLRLDLWERHLKSAPAPHVFAFSRETVTPGAFVHSRMFAPALGIPEDPATGAASGPLGCYLARYELAGGEQTQFISEQGLEMGRPSFIHIRIERTEGQISRVAIAGEAVLVGEGAFHLD
jgi:trans-2,3-dihydro-3-hydroxyanthranilate isomerase